MTQKRKVSGKKLWPRKKSRQQRPKQEKKKRKTKMKMKMEMKKIQRPLPEATFSEMNTGQLSNDQLYCWSANYSRKERGEKLRQ